MKRGERLIKIVFLRHGESIWNLKHDFTGWHDCDLSPHGKHEARVAGDIMRSQGFVFDIVYTSLLKRAIRTMWIVLDAMDLMWLPIRRSWRLNERHYGALEELDKREMMDVFGAEQLRIWRRSWDQAPPPLDIEDERHPTWDPRYHEFPDVQMPASESLKDCTARVLPYWKRIIVPRLKEGKKILIVAHGNSLRGIVKYLDDVPDDEIPHLNIPTGVPLVYELDEKNDFKPIRHYYLGNQEEIKRRIEAVKNQAQK